MKLQKEIFKAAEKKIESTKYVRFEYFITTADGTGFDFGISEGHFVKFYKESQFVIDLSKVSERVEPFNCSGCLEGLKEAQPLTITNEIRVLDKKKTVVALTFAGGTKTWIDDKFLGYFENKFVNRNGFQFFAVNKKAPVYIKDGDLILGLILPVNMNN